MKLPETFRTGRDLDEKTAQLLEESYVAKEDPLTGEGLEELLASYQEGMFDAFLFTDLLEREGYTKKEKVDERLCYYLRFREFEEIDLSQKHIIADILIKDNSRSTVCGEFLYAVVEGDNAYDFCVGHSNMMLKSRYSYHEKLWTKFSNKMMYVDVFGAILGCAALGYGMRMLGGDFETYSALGYLIGGLGFLGISRLLKNPLFNRYKGKKMKELEQEVQNLERITLRYVTDSENALVEAFS